MTKRAAIRRAERLAGNLKAKRQREAAINNATRWLGVRVSCRRVTARVGEGDFENPQWFDEYVGTERKAVEVTYRQETFLIDDEDGTGWYKVTKGRGSPTVHHRRLPPSSEILEVLWS